MTDLNDEYSRDQRLILYRLDSLTTEVRAARRDINALKLAFASKAAMWGAAGSIPALLAALIAMSKGFR